VLGARQVSPDIQKGNKGVGKRPEGKEQLYSYADSREKTKSGELTETRQTKTGKRKGTKACDQSEFRKKGASAGDKQWEAREISGSKMKKKNANLDQTVSRGGLNTRKETETGSLNAGEEKRKEKGLVPLVILKKKRKITLITHEENANSTTGRTKKSVPEHTGRE